jgi:D-alanyl-D-alanine carboxypeptidase
VNPRNVLSNLGFLRLYSVRAIALALSFSLVIPAVSAQAVPAECPVGVINAACQINNPKSTHVVVNKIRPLTPKNHYPSDLVRVAKFNPLGRILRKEVAAAIIAMGNQMYADKQGTLVVQSGFRSYSSQVSIHSAKVKSIGKVAAEKLAARPGHSEHQTGLAVDFAAKGVSTLTTSFAKTKAGIWLAANSWKYGFVIRYPKGKTAITGYQFEPWHFRYVGIATSTAMHDQGIQTLEEYYSLSAAPEYLN